MTAPRQSKNPDKTRISVATSVLSTDESSVVLVKSRQPKNRNPQLLAALLVLDLVHTWDENPR